MIRSAISSGSPRRPSGDLRQDLSWDSPDDSRTGVNIIAFPSSLEDRREVRTAAARVGLLVDPRFRTPERAMRDVTAAASAMGLQVDVVQASDSREIESVFRTLVDNKADALLVGPDAFLGHVLINRGAWISRA